MSLCPTCGRHLPLSEQERREALLRGLQMPVQWRPAESKGMKKRRRPFNERRSVYVGRDGLWYLTHGGELGFSGPFTTEDIAALCAADMLVRTYPEIADSYELKTEVPRSTMREPSDERRRSR